MSVQRREGELTCKNQKQFWEGVRLLGNFLHSKCSLSHRAVFPTKQQQLTSCINQLNYYLKPFPRGTKQVQGSQLGGGALFKECEFGGRRMVGTQAGEQ